MRSIRERLDLLGGLVEVIGLSMHDTKEQETAMIRAGAIEYLHKGGPSERRIPAIRMPT